MKIVFFYFWGGGGKGGSENDRVGTGTIAKETVATWDTNPFGPISFRSLFGGAKNSPTLRLILLWSPFYPPDLDYVISLLHLTGITVDEKGIFIADDSLLNTI